MNLFNLSKSVGCWLFMAGLGFSAILSSFAVNNYHSARPIAEDRLRSLALTLSSTIESLANQDPSLSLLHGISSQDVAFFVVFDRSGTQLFHTNPVLVGRSLANPEFRDFFEQSTLRERRVTLGTGELAYEFLAPLHLGSQTLALRLVLHTYQADVVIRRAATGMAILFSLLAGGWVMGCFLYYYDQRANRHLQEMAKQKHLAQLGTMSAVLAHEVRNPLSGIKGYAQLLEEKLENPELQVFAHQVVAESVRLEDLVNNLLAFAQPDLLVLCPVDLDRVISSTCSLLSPQAVEHRVQLTPPKPSGLFIVAEVDRLQQILLNLILNAIQATPAGGSVQIAAERFGKAVRISVIDTGQGIEPADQAQLFEPFFTRRARGSGLGLAICKKYIEEMRGSIEVSSAPGQGSAFRIFLPAAEKERKKERP
jgi:two-component system sensor histidine kinase HydH